MMSFYGAKNGSFVDVFSFCLLDYLLDMALVIAVVAVVAYRKWYGESNCAVFISPACYQATLDSGVGR